MDPYIINPTTNDTHHTITKTSDEKCLSGYRSPPTGFKALQPIIWLLNVNRHFKATRMVRYWDRPYERKIDQAVFRGLLTGLEYNRNATDEINCENLIRCRVVYKYAHSNLVDAKVTSTFRKMPEMYHGVNLTGNEMNQKEILEYKGIISLEGNGKIYCGIDINHLKWKWL